MALAVLQARMSSRRLPGKVLRDMAGKPMLSHQVERVRRCAGLDLVLATSTDPSDDVLEEWARREGLPCCRGPLDDVLARFVATLERFPGDPVVRLTGDCPLSDPELIASTLAAHQRVGADYSSNVLDRHLPDGLDVEVVERRALYRAARESDAPDEREHVTLHLVRHPDRFRLHSVRHGAMALGARRWTVDTADDFRFVRSVFEALYPSNPRFGWRDVLAWSEGPARRFPSLAGVAS